MKTEKKTPNGINYNFNKVTDESQNQLVNQMIKRLTPPVSFVCS